ncbi:MAG: DUF1836 domain-containing protein [Bacillota bacterium]|nr:DUF1836 domain-containing protein [Bacillota bacterium]
MDRDFAESQEVKEVLHFKCKRSNELPNLKLYMDQVTSFINEMLNIFTLDEKDKLTKSMVNNYVKQKIIAAPTDKKYSRGQLMSLIIVCMLKRVFSIGEISEIMKLTEKNYEFDVAYDCFCDEFEKALKSVFGNKASVDKDNDSVLIKKVVLSLANKLYLQKYIQFLGIKE